MVTQVVFLSISGNVTLIALSLIFSFALNGINTLDWCLNQRHFHDFVVCDYYLEIEIEPNDTFSDDL